MDHVMIVEDHEENRNLLKILLEVNGYRVTDAGDGVEALAAARRDPPDAVVSDALMPNMDGFALCRAWMQDPVLKSIPFIFYSSTYVRPDDERFGHALGAVRYIIKPVEAQVFLQELRDVLQQWSGRAAPAPEVPLDDTTSHALHEAALARKVEDKMAQLEATNRVLRGLVEPLNSLREVATQLEVTNRALRASEQKYRRIYDNLQDVYIEARLDGAILEIGPQIATLSKGQYKREDLIGTSLDALYADTRERDAVFEAIKRDGRAIDVDAGFRNRDGSLVPCSVSATIVRGPDNEASILATWRDISGRKR
ncbi:MAG: response regulator [Burkholderiales bacterium]|nr:response regulator [Burkholderiales bacterium]